MAQNIPAYTGELLDRLGVDRATWTGGGMASFSPLTGEQERLKESAPGVMGALGRFLDQDNDGSVMDDVGGMLGKAFGR